MPRVRTLDGLGNAVDAPNEILNENDITLLVRRSGPESWRNTATKTGNDYQNAKDTARYYDKLKIIDDNEKKKNDKRGNDLHNKNGSGGKKPTNPNTNRNTKNGNGGGNT